MKGIPASLGSLHMRRDDIGWHYAVQLDESHANVQGVVHGGVLMTFLDHAASLVIWESTDRALCSTVHLDTHFMAAVKPPAFVECDFKILRRGKRLVYARGELLVDGEVVVQANGVWSIAYPRKTSDGD